MLQLIVSGIIFGCIYGLTAIGLVLIYKTTDIVNFAFGEMAMLVTFVGFMFFMDFGLSYVSFFIAASLFAVILGGLTYWLLLRPIQQSSHISQVVLTLGIYMVIHGIVGLIWGHTPTSFPLAISMKQFKLEAYTLRKMRFSL